MAVMSPLELRRLQELMRRDPTALARLSGLQTGAANLGEVAALAAPPAKMVTPAAPAPLQPGQEIVAPPVAPKRDLNVAPVGPGTRTQALPTTGEAVIGAARMAAAEKADKLRAVQAPQEVLDVLAQRKERIGKDLEEVETDRKRAGWEALAQAGFKMAQSQSPYFMSALAAGMEAGLNGYSAKKAASAERKARLQEQQENLALDQLRERRAEQQYQMGLQGYESGLVEKQMGQDKAAADIALANVVRPYQVEAAQLAPQATRAQIAGEQADVGLKNAQAGYYNRSPGAGLGDSASSGGIPRGVITLRNSLVNQLNAQLKIANDRLNVSPAERQKAAATASALQTRLEQIDTQLGLGGGGGGGVGAAPAGGGSMIESITPVGGPTSTGPRTTRSGGNQIPADAATRKRGIENLTRRMHEAVQSGNRALAQQLYNEIEDFKSFR